MEGASTSFSFDDIIPSTPETQKLGKTFPKRKSSSKWQCDAEVIPLVEQETLKSKLEKSNVPLKSQVYVFHSLSAVLKYKPATKPLNNYIKVIGEYYETNRSSIPYVRGYEVNDQKLALFVDLKMVKCTPQINEVIEIFGHLEFRMVVNHSVPIIIVHFCMKLTDCIPSYIECLTMQNIFLMEDTFKVETEPDIEENDSLTELLQDLSFGIISMDENECCSEIK